MTNQLAEDSGFLRPRRSTQRTSVTFLPEPLPEEIWCPIISADDHVVEPLDLIEARVPARYQDDIPKVWKDAEDVPFWVVDGLKLPITVSNGAVGRPMSEWTHAPQKLDEFRPGVTDPLARLSDMDKCGIWAQLNFPSVPWGFCCSRLTKLKNREAGFAALRAYNDWLSEWCDAAPERFIRSQVAWLGDPAQAAHEIYRNAERGFVCVSFCENPERLGLPSLYSDEWDVFFAACQESNTVINLHVGSSGVAQQPSNDSPVEVITALFPVNGMLALVDWIYARIPLKFPGLKIVLSEAGVSWVPSMIERLHRAYRQAEASGSWSTGDPDPVDILRRNFWFTSIEDPSGFSLIDQIGDDRVMVETDFPHCDSTWPFSQQMIRSEMSSLTPTQVRKVCFQNAAALYRHPLPPSEWIEGSIIGLQSGLPAPRPRDDVMGT